MVRISRGSLMRLSDWNSGTRKPAVAVTEPDPDPETPEGTVYNLSFGVQRNRSHLVLLDPANALHNYAAPEFIWDLRVFNSLTEFTTYRDAAKVLNADMTIVGYYRSCIHSTETSTLPIAMPLSSSMESGWDTGVLWPGETDRWFINMSVADARAYIITAAIANAQTYGLDGVGFDCCYNNIFVSAALHAVVSKADWSSAYLSFFQEAYTACQAAGLKVVYNVATDPDKIAAGFAAAMDYADGLMTEAAFYYKTTSSITTELAGYETVLAAGKSVYLIPYAATAADRIPNETLALGYIDTLARTYPGKIFVTCAGSVHDNAAYFITI